MQDLKNYRNLCESAMTAVKEGMGKWYIMKAHHINDGKGSKIKDIALEEPNSVVTAVKTRDSGKKLFIVSGSAGGPIGSEHDYIFDTGMGHRKPSYKDLMLVVENIITIKDGNIVDKINDIGVNEKRYTYVFK